MPLASVTVIRTLSFSIYTSSKTTINDAGHLRRDRIGDKALLGALAGASSGVLISVLACPLELIKISAQLEKEIADRRGVPYVPSTTAQAARSIWRSERFRGLYYGLPLHTLRDGAGTALYFCLYDGLRTAVDKTFSDELPFGAPKTAAPFVCGSAAGMISWACVNGSQRNIDASQGVGARRPREDTSAA